MTRRTPFLLAALVLSLPGCRDSTGSAGFVVTGRIQNNTPGPLPPDTRLIAVWGVVSGSPDYAYVFGSGTIDRASGRFQIHLDAPPPAAALNSGELGVAFLVATTDPSLTDGDVITSAPLSGVVGITAQHAVIFVGSHQAGVQLPEWAGLFPPGFSLGAGVKATSGFDTFQPASPFSARLIVDDPANIDVVNWS